jgi:monoterpene epsilon-lactone hydrolase
VSPEAQAALLAPPIVAGTVESPADGDGWHRYIDAVERGMLDALVWTAHPDLDIHVEETDVDGVPVHRLTPLDVARDDPRIYVELHGGALVFGSGACCRAMGLATASRTRRTTWAVDFRMPPDHPFPAGLEDSVRVYRAILETHLPKHVVIGGASSGANLAAATVLAARDAGLPLPAALVLLAPELDLTESGDSFQTNLGVDTVLPGSLMDANRLYAGSAALTDPYVSPLFGDFRGGFPPTLVASGTRDLFLSNAVRMHRALRAADVDAELHLVEAAPHGGFYGSAPEDLALDAEICRFLDDHCPQPAARAG